jgi:hypothetical protein
VLLDAKEGRYLTHYSFFATVINDHMKTKENIHRKARTKKKKKKKTRT